MDVLASIFAYFGTLAAIIVGFAMSYDVLIYAPTHSAAPPHASMVAIQPNTAKAAEKPAATARRQSAAARSFARSGPEAKSVAEERAAARLRAERLRNAYLQKPNTGRFARKTRA